VPGPAAGATARRDRWSRLRRLLWQPPRPHGEQPRERTVGPLELFYDLAVVVLVGQAAHRLAGHLTWPGFGQFAVIFTLAWIAWANGSLHHDLHGHEDARARSTFLLQILILAAMGAFIPQAGGARGAAFAVTAGVLFAVLAVLWLLAARGDRPEYRRPSRLFVTGTAACAPAGRHHAAAGWRPRAGLGPDRRRLPGRIHRRDPRRHARAGSRADRQ
jgi:Bacterial low temperature requirement A protein (LtrA)